jgi:hypothetical protein
MYGLDYNYKIYTIKKAVNRKDNIMGLLCQVPLNTTLQVAYGMSWHHKLPALAVGGDKKVHVYLLKTAKSQPS